MGLMPLLVVVILLAAGLSPWWLAGRYCIPARERLPLHELEPVTIVLTLRRGADWFVPPRYR